MEAPRSGLVVLLVALTLVATPLALVGTWARTTLLDTDDWVRTVAPLAADPRVQDAVADRVAGGVAAALPLDELAGALPDALPDAVDDRAAAAAERRVVELVRTGSAQVVGSDAFAHAWVAAHRTFHGQLVGVVRGRPDALGQVDADGRLRLDLTPLVDDVRGRVVDAGVPDRLVPRPTVVVTVLDGGATARLQRTVGTAERAAAWAPWVGAAAAAGAVLLARRRARALAWVAGAVVLGAAAALVGVRAARAGALASPAAAFLGDPVVALAVDHVTAGLVAAVWWVGGVALVVLVAAATGDAPRGAPTDPARAGGRPDVPPRSRGSSGAAEHRVDDHDEEGARGGQEAPQRPDQRP